jgi:hypothetical protein
MRGHEPALPQSVWTPQSLQVSTPGEDGLATGRGTPLSQVGLHDDGAARYAVAGWFTHVQRFILDEEAAGWPTPAPPSPDFQRTSGPGAGRGVDGLGVGRIDGEVLDRWPFCGRRRLAVDNWKLGGLVARYGAGGPGGSTSGCPIACFWVSSTGPAMPEAGRYAAGVDSRGAAGSAVEGALCERGGGVAETRPGLALARPRRALDGALFH